LNAQISTRESSRRGGRKNQAEKWRIEGEFLTYAEIGERLGVSTETARFRMQKLRGASGKITIDRLRDIGKRESAA
jgi:hypothetical protein